MKINLNLPPALLPESPQRPPLRQPRPDPPVLVPRPQEHLRARAALRTALLAPHEALAGAEAAREVPGRSGRLDGAGVDRIQGGWDVKIFN